MKYPDHGIFVGGVDTGVGKTFVAALIARTLAAAGRRVGVYKPVASGCSGDAGSLRSEDVDALCEAAGVEDKQLVCPQMFAAPLAPNLAAREEGKEVDAELLRAGLCEWTDRCDIVVVEGIGGLMSPVSDDDYAADLAFEFGYPLVVVAPNILGVINQTLQTLITAATFRDGIEVAGIVLNQPRSAEQVKDDPSVHSNFKELQSHCVPPILGQVAWGADQFDRSIDWWTIAARDR